MTQTPVFVKIEEFKEILASLNAIKDKLNQASQVLTDINDLKTKEDTELESWKESLNQVSDKVNAMDAVLFEQG
ncbi:MAG: hypothetical protein GXP63_07025 [DPANN group archaeon]|nr:hypothetical protein [DPANN group archaeon]